MRTSRTMRRFLTATILSAAVAGVGGVAFCQQPAWAQLGQANPPATPAAAAATQPAAQVPVRAVVLFSSGVGYFEHYGSVNGNASTELRFKTQQINDILKSLVLEDLNGGSVSAITYPSQNPLEKTLRSFEVDLSANPSLGELLNQVRGAKVKVLLQGEEVEGTILGLEKKPKAAGDKAVIEVWMLNLIAGGDVRSVELDEVRKLELEDPELQKELHEALSALAQARDQDKKPVTIQFVGQGQRDVRLGYVVETPIWKTSYRLLLGQGAAKRDAAAEVEDAIRAAHAATQPGGGGGGAGASDKAMLQGWAIVENQTDNDWNNVELSLVSGRPISFIEDLYQPLYVPRPVVEPELYASLRPQTYEGGMEEKDEKSTGAFGVDGAKGQQELSAAAAPMGAGGGGGLFGGKGDRGYERNRGDVDQLRRQLEQPFNAAASISSVASASKAGELFQYTVGSVSLPRQRSAMIPILNDPIQAQPLSIYNQSVQPRFPLYGVRLTNNTTKHLLQGPVTVFDAQGHYAGDASIDNVPPGQQRLLSYGVDLQILMDATKNDSTRAIVSGSIVKGVLKVSYRTLMTQEYLAENKGTEDKTLIIEHPVHPGWKLVEGKDEPKPKESTPSVWRFEDKVAAGKSSKLIVHEEIVQGQQIALLPADVESLVVYTRSGQIDPKVREALQKAIELKNAMMDTQRQMEQKQGKINEISSEQPRIREDMKTVPQNSEYYGRMMKKLNDQETQIEGDQEDLKGLRAKFEEQRKQLEDYVGGMNVG